MNTLLQLLPLRINTIVKCEKNVYILIKSKWDYTVLDKWLLACFLVTFCRMCALTWDQLPFDTVCSDNLVLARDPKSLICYSLITMCVCIQHNLCYTWTEKKLERERETEEDFHFQVWIPQHTTRYLNPIRCRIPFFLPTSLSLGYDSAPLITMFTTCWHPESYVGSVSGGTEIKRKEFQKHFSECADIRGSDMQERNWALKCSKRQ